MHVLDYNAFRDRLLDAIEARGFECSVDEMVFLNSASRGCDIFVYPDGEGGEVWGKVSFEWLPSNQALLDELNQQSSESDIDASAWASDPDAEVMMHFSFHLHFDSLSIATEAVTEAAEEIKALGETFFGDDGGMVAEVSMTSADARLECLRFEVDTSAPLISEEAWWDDLAEVCRAMLDKLEQILARLRLEYGSSRGTEG